MFALIETWGQQNWVGVVILVWIIIISTWDGYRMWRYGTSGTISGYLNQISKRWLPFAYLVAFTMGMLFGHLFL